jgi:hypothetical protein
MNLLLQYRSHYRYTSVAAVRVTLQIQTCCCKAGHTTDADVLLQCLPHYIYRCIVAVLVTLQIKMYCCNAGHTTDTDVLLQCWSHYRYRCIVAMPVTLQIQMCCCTAGHTTDTDVLLQCWSRCRYICHTSRVRKYLYYDKRVRSTATLSRKLMFSRVVAAVTRGAVTVGNSQLRLGDHKNYISKLFETRS